MPVQRLDEDDAWAMVAALEAQVERLQDELDHLRGAQGLHFLAPLQFRLTAAETKILGRLLKGGVATKDGLMAVLYRNDGKDETEIKIVDVFVCKLRKKISSWGLEITTRWGVGYEMSPEMIAKFKADWGYGHEGPKAP